ncbi:hypothetical protein BJY04DRAFT_199087 [Aspergillus karnatakaensis]|uniref:uncharacterized protein n=1 Tax=Aspergillus karnatakaensis TaxID=1810916 RepID=UPI003CCC9F40
MLLLGSGAWGRWRRRVFRGLGRRPWWWGFRCRGRGRGRCSSHFGQLLRGTLLGGQRRLWVDWTYRGMSHWSRRSGRHRRSPQRISHCAW